MPDRLFSNACRRPRLRFAPPLLMVCLIGLMLSVGGCVYRIDIQQGNYLEPGSIEQVGPGMTRSQVRFLLGTPMIADPFHADRWDYVYYFKPGKRGKIENRRVTVYFEDDAVSRVENTADG